MEKPTVDIYGGIAAGFDQSAGHVVILCLGQHRKEFLGWVSGVGAKDVAISALLDGLERLTKPCCVRFHACHQAFVYIFENKAQLERDWTYNTGFGGGKEEVGKLLGQLQVHDVKLIVEPPEQPLVAEATQMAYQQSLQGNSIVKYLMGEACCCDPLPNTSPEKTPAEPNNVHPDDAAYQNWLKDPFSSAPPRTCYRPGMTHPINPT